MVICFPGFCLLHLLSWKGLVKIFDKLETGQLKEGSSYSFLVRQMHETSKEPQGKEKVQCRESKAERVSRWKNPFMKIRTLHVYVVQKDGLNDKSMNVPLDLMRILFSSTYPLIIVIHIKTNHKRILLVQIKTFRPYHNDAQCVHHS